jgi:hypothetical protein
VRLTINLQDDLYRMAKSMAIAENCSISVAVNKLLRRGILGKESIERPKRKGFPVVKGRRPFTSDDVYKIEES